MRADGYPELGGHLTEEGAIRDTVRIPAYR